MEFKDNLVKIVYFNENSLFLFFESATETVSSAYLMFVNISPTCRNSFTFFYFSHDYLTVDGKETLRHNTAMSYTNLT